MYLQRHVGQWWFEPEIKLPRIRIPKRLCDLDPSDPKNAANFRPRSKIAGFQHSSKWVRYNRLQAVDAGYITPLYDLNNIAKRYGLSVAGRQYFRRHILPEPFDIVRRRSVQAHHWSRFTLMVLDVVLGDLEGRGQQQFLRKYADHVQLVHDGVAYLHKHYENKSMHQVVDRADRYGVEWIT